MSEPKPTIENTEVERQELGKRLREAREYLGLSQDDVAKYLKVPRTALTNIESGLRKVDALELRRLSDLYRQPVSHFTGGDDDVAELPAGVAHLARAAAALSAQDRKELERFVDYLRSRSPVAGDKK